jgi:hypothetical protein
MNSNVTFSFCLFFEATLCGFMSKEVLLGHAVVKDTNMTFIKWEAPFTISAYSGIQLRRLVWTRMEFKGSMTDMICRGPFRCESVFFSNSSVTDYSCDFKVCSEVPSEVGEVSPFEFVDCRITEHRLLSPCNESGVWHVYAEWLPLNQTLRIINCCFAMSKEHWFVLSPEPRAIAEITRTVSDTDCLNDRPRKIPYGVVGNYATMLKVPLHMRPYFRT